ncbi:hypothetical protein D3C86_1338800 [compost metagenome]
MRFEALANLSNPVSTLPLLNSIERLKNSLLLGFWLTRKATLSPELTPRIDVVGK